jgi:hypothetical protein
MRHGKNTMSLNRSVLVLCAFAAAAQSFGAAFPLDSALSRGDSSLNIVWTPDSMNTRPGWYGRCCTTDSNYFHCDFKAGAGYRGEAYSYGGEDPYDLFRTRLSRGALAGSHDCHYYTCGDPSDSVTGTDCSGFLCYLWNEPRVSTVDLAASARYVHIDKRSLAAGDALIRSGSHSAFVVEVTDSTEVLIWEAYGWPVNGCRERVVDVTASAWNSYVAIRNPNLSPAGVIGGGGYAAGRPIVNTHERIPPAVFDVQGKLVLKAGPSERPGTGRGRLLLSLRPGVYIFKYATGDGTVSTAVPVMR